MTATDPNPPSLIAAPNPKAEAAIKPSWKPLFWFLGGMAALVALWEIFFDLLLEGLESLGEGIFYAVEGSEELLEDKIEEWFDLDPYHAEVITAWTMTPLKVLLAFVVLRWLWRVGRHKLLPKAASYCDRQIRSVYLAWQTLGWALKVLIIIAMVGGLLILI